VKVAFDENVPIAMVRVFQALAAESQFQKLGVTIQSAKDYTPKPSDLDYLPKNDTPWIKRFSTEGGKVVISGNARMMNIPHERLALLDEGLIVLFFENRWNNWKFFTKCALLLLWFPAIAKTAKTATPKTFWRIPSIWDEKAKLRPQSTGDLKLEKLERKRSSREKAKKRVEGHIKQAAERIHKVSQADQPDFHDLMAPRNDNADQAPAAKSETSHKE